jgi:hypothetical protein
VIAPAAPTPDSRVVPFKVTGGGIAAHGLPLQLHQPAPHNATGTATELGNYSAEGMFQLDSFTSATTGTFSSAQPVVFVAANGDQLAFNYAGTFQIFDAGGGKVYAVFVADFTPVSRESTGRFTKVTGGSLTMVATTEPFVLGSTDPTGYTWEGKGSLVFSKDDHDTDSVWSPPRDAPTLSDDHQQEQGRPLLHGLAAEESDTQVKPFKVTGGGTAPNGLPVFPGGTAPHNATGTATGLGKYTGNEGVFELLSFDPATGTGTFKGSFVFVAANGDRLACNYGADPTNPGTFTLIPAGDGKVVAVFVAEFTPDPQHSTGRFARVTGGSFLMVATTEPFDPTPNAQGYTVPFAYTWEGEGSLVFGKGND